MTEESTFCSNESQSLHRPSSHSWVEIDLATIRHNVRALKKFIGPQRHLWAVVKANAYGHGAVPIATTALAAGADGLAVSCLSEAAELRMDAGIRAPLIVLAPGEARAAAWMVRLDIILTACSRSMMEGLSKAAQRLDKPARVHIKVDTGMGRLGIVPSDVVEFARSLVEMPGIQVEGTFSHLATAESDDPAYARMQQEKFEAALSALADAGYASGMRHLANSAATLRFSDMLYDAVRTGLLIYGIQPDAPGPAYVDLRPAMSWKTQISFVHKLPAGGRVSYGGTHVAAKDSLIAVLPLGYADGYPRSASNRARVLIRGQACSVVGVVCMDHTMVDITDVEDAQVGDEVILLGRQGKDDITANELAAMANTVVHEIPTLIGRRVKRVYLDRDRLLQADLVSEGEMK